MIILLPLIISLVGIVLIFYGYRIFNFKRFSAVSYPDFKQRKQVTGAKAQVSGIIYIIGGMLIVFLAVFSYFYLNLIQYS